MKPLNEIKLYLIMDPRALKDVDKALVVETCESLKEVEEAFEYYDSMHIEICIVDADTKKVIDSSSARCKQREQ
jgi:hypothetical protein